ncbi:ATP-binding protein [Nocardioides sp. GY 10127]|uniref:ATP-binding protein n=1 Tax=Nocardioides sp. GY 10127 TaxID=2569762 RepID=UPI0010A76180|nr:ATP-binding protein [Nocardioides sp. GY 10127]TIC81753.1 hypothetical protein E8D37_11240 [Nocardioides sp. GY 10127]
MTGAPQRGRAVAGFVLAAAVLGLLVLAGLRSVPAGGHLAATWPAAGAALLWVLTRRSRAAARAAIATSGLVTFGVGALATGDPAFAALMAVADTTQLVVVVLLATGRGVQLPYARTDLRRVVLAIVVGSAVGTLLATGGATALGTSFTPLEIVAWWGRQAVGLSTVGFIGVFLWVEHRQGRTLLGEVLKIHRRPALERLPLVIASVISYAVMLLPEDAYIFLAIPPAIWVASRYSSVFSALHVLGVSGAAIGLTAAGASALAEPSNSPAAVVLGLQIFLLTLISSVLSTAVVNEQRSGLLDEVVQRDHERAERLELFDRTTAAMSEGLAVFEEDGTLVTANEVATLLLATTDLDGCEDGCATRLPLSDALEGRRHSQDVVVRTTGSRPRDLVLAVTAAPLRASESWGGRRRVLVVFRDVTDERAGREALTDFAARAAHDLRSPVAAARSWIGFTQHQLQAGEAVDPQDVSESLDATAAALDRMIALVSGLLEQATAEDGRLRCTPTDLAAPDGPLLRAHELQAPDAELVVGPLPCVEADPELLLQLFGNLLGNAVKYAAAGRAPRVHVSGSLDGDRVLVRITDNGIGVPADLRDTVFDRLTRVHGHLGVTGSGLGLSICRTIVERHGGTIRCEEADPAAGLAGTGGPGTTFVLDLPAAARATSADPRDQPRPPSSHLHDSGGNAQTSFTEAAAE